MGIIVETSKRATFKFADLHLRSDAALTGKPVVKLMAPNPINGDLAQRDFPRDAALVTIC